MGLSINMVSRISQALPSGMVAISLPVCANQGCTRPPTLWQRWWSRKQGIHLEAHWYCSAECLQQGLLRRIDRLLWNSPAPRRAPGWLPLGLMLLGQGLISEEQLRAGLAQQRESGTGRIGEWLVKLGYVRPHDVTAALAVQQNCPLFSSTKPAQFPARFRFPRALARLYGGVPIHWSQATRCLYLAFASPVVKPLLQAVEQVMQCKVEPCIISEKTHRAALEEWETKPAAEAVCIEQRQSSRAMASSIVGYAIQTGAEGCVTARCEDHLWARLYGAMGSVDLLFRSLPEQPSGHLF